MCLILAPGGVTECQDKESEWFSLKNEDLNINIDNDIKYSNCNLKGELFNFLWKYISYIEINIQNTLSITKELYDYRKNI